MQKILLESPCIDENWPLMTAQFFTRYREVCMYTGKHLGLLYNKVRERCILLPRYISDSDVFDSQKCRRPFLYISLMNHWDKLRVEEKIGTKFRLVPASFKSRFPKKHHHVKRLCRLQRMASIFDSTLFGRNFTPATIFSRLVGTILIVYCSPVCFFGRWISSGRTNVVKDVK